jgi:hypothetical protein
MEDAPMIVPFGDDLRQHGLLTTPLLEAIVNKQMADTELAMQLLLLPRWYRERIQAMAAQGRDNGVCWWEDVDTVCGTCIPHHEIEAEEAAAQ